MSCCIFLLHCRCNFVYNTCTISVYVHLYLCVCTHILIYKMDNCLHLLSVAGGVAAAVVGGEVDKYFLIFMGKHVCLCTFVCICVWTRIFNVGVNCLHHRFFFVVSLSLLLFPEGSCSSSCCVWYLEPPSFSLYCRLWCEMTTKRFN